MADPQVLKIVRALENVTQRAIVKITLDATANLIEATPVDIGWARANWVPAIGGPGGSGAQTSRPDSGSVSAQAAAQQQAISRIPGYRLGQGAVFISNNVPYITRLNDGSSSQAPANFVQAAVVKAVTQDIQGLS